MATRKSKNVKEINEFEKPGKISGGNSYECYVERQVQEDVVKSSFGYNDVSTIGTTVDKEVETYINNTVPHWWILLQEQANYFCNQFQWDIDDVLLKSLIVNTIRCSFYNGKGGLYYNDVTEQFEAVVPSNMNYNSAGELLGCKYTPANQYLDGINEQEKYNHEGIFNIPKSKIKNLAVFKWGTESLDCWRRILPYVRKQHMMMEMMTVQTFAYNKKYIYKCNESEAAKKELALFFNPKIPFIVNAGFASEINGNRFEELDLSSSGGLEFLEYYKEMMSIIYSQIGRRQNTDIKKERNVSGEIQASQENFDILFLDTNRQFNIFVKNANVILKEHNKPEIDIILEDRVEQQEQENMNNETKGSFENDRSNNED